MSTIAIHDGVNHRAASLPGAERALAEDATSFVARLHQESEPQHQNLLRRRDEPTHQRCSDGRSRWLGEQELYAPARESYEWQDGEQPRLKQWEREDARVSARDQLDVRLRGGRCIYEVRSPFSSRS